MQYIVAYPVVLLVRSFANQMFEGNTSVAIKLRTGQIRGGFLS